MEGKLLLKNRQIFKFKCYECDTSCKECSGANNNECTYCYAGEFLNEDGYCTNDCGIYYYANETDRKVNYFLKQFFFK